MTVEREKRRQTIFNSALQICTHTGEESGHPWGAISPPIYQTSLFRYNDEDPKSYTYTRDGNPTTTVAEEKLAALEGADAAVCFSSGMAAVTASIFSVVKAGDHIILVRNAYSPTQYLLSEYLRKFGITTTFVDGKDPAEFSEAVTSKTTVIYLESPTTFLFEMQDLKAIAGIARQHNIVTIIDNSWATPLYQRPLEHGIDLVLHSASKYLGGHSDIVAGVAAGCKERIETIRQNERPLLGASMDPHQAWLLIRGLRTLPIRLEQHRRSALEIAAYLEQHDKVGKVNYPALPSCPQFELAQRQMDGESSLFSFILDTSGEKAAQFIKALRLFTSGPSWGGYESLAIVPALRTEPEYLDRLGVPLNLIRVHIGLEDTTLLLEDLERALRRM